MDNHRFTGPVWSLFRLVTGLLFTFHGASTVLGLFGGSRGTGDALPAGQWPGWYAGLIQLVCGLLVLAGLFTRPAALLASGSMAYAYFTVHQPQALLPIENGGVNSALYAWAFLAIAVLGAGPWSLDAWWHRRTGSTTPAADSPPASPSASAPASSAAASPASSAASVPASTGASVPASSAASVPASSAASAPGEPAASPQAASAT